MYDYNARIKEITDVKLASDFAASSADTLWNTPLKMTQKLHPS